jgi:hypothetical protein
MGKATLRVSPELWLALLSEPGSEPRAVRVVKDAIPVGSHIVDVRVDYTDVTMTIESPAFTDGQVLTPTCEAIVRPRAQVCADHGCQVLPDHCHAAMVAENTSGERQEK